MNATKGVGGRVDLPHSNIRDNGRPQDAADYVELGEMHENSDGFIRANDIVEQLSDNSGNLDADKVLQALQDAVELGARLAREANGRPIRVIYGADGYGDCRFYFIGTASDVAFRLRKMVA